MGLLYESSVLTSDTKKEGQKFWRTWAYKDESGAYTQTEAWRSTNGGGESKRIVSAPTKVEGKNQGKKNETTPEQQAVLEAQAEERRKRERKGYWVLGEAKPEGVYRAMLALQGAFNDNKHHIKYGAAVQPKYDGHRCVFDGVRGWSREANEIVPECLQHLAFDTGGLLLDGELMLPHGEYTFEDTTSAIKAYKPELSPKLAYFVYDIYDKDKTFQERLEVLQAVAAKFPAQVHLVPTRMVANEEEVLDAFGEFREEGHEGAIVRNLAGRYLPGHRSNDLVKVKGMNVTDGEFTVVGVEEGIGKFVGMPVYLLQDKGGREVGKATPKGTFPQKRAAWARREELLGKVVTVQYQGFTAKGKLRFGVILRVREDL